MKPLLAGLAGLLVASAAPVQSAGDPQAGRIKSEPCLGCHGIAGYNNVYPTYHVPKITGQSAEYLVSALQAYKSQLRDHATMQAQAASMSEQDMQDIAAFWSTAGN